MSKTSNPQKRRRSLQGVFRPNFIPNLAAGGTGIDLVSGVAPVTSISGTRYGIVNGLVTQFAVNQPPIEDDGLRGCPAFTQLASYSEDLSQVTWGKNNTQLGSISLYRGYNITKIVENTSTAIHSLTKPTALTGAADNSVVGMSFIAKAAERSVIQIVLLKKDATSAICNINLITGVVSGNTGGMIAVADALSDGYYRIFVFCSAGAGGSTPNLYWRLLDSSSQFSYTGDGLSGIFYGQPTYANFGVAGIPFIPPYVPNNTTGSISVVSEAATSTTGTSFDLDDAKLANLKTALRGPSAQGHLELEFVSNVDSWWLANNTNLSMFTASNSNATGLFIRKDSGGQVSFRFVDYSLNLSAYVANIIVNTPYKISLDWGTHSTGQKMMITVNGVKSALGNFSGSWGAQDLRFFYGNTVHAGWIVKDSLKVMDRPQW